jgi:hypothetical protein
MTAMGMVMLCRAHVADRAAQYDPALAEQLRYGYRHALAAHVALDALRAVDTDEQHTRRRHEQQVLRAGLERLAEWSPLFEGVAGQGSHVRLVMNRRWFPQRSNSILTLAVEGSLMDIIVRRCRVVVADQRFFPPLFGRAGTMHEAMQRLTDGLADVTPAHVYANLITRMSVHSLRRAWRSITTTVTSEPHSSRLSAGEQG